MERDIEARLAIAAERMGTGLLRAGAALERIAKSLEKKQDATKDADAKRA